ncbi:hypothetical protein OIU85_001840 [Salix viminalis]|uniref:Uncharacterized protein n=1 Tax=Salix viminalis TaxID=40686 RepID=A0A9Q0ZYM1_SALVM|nr:hypothetical protein OIU85_001840 [Salix viminalis]
MADFSVVDTDLKRLASLLLDQAMKENTQIEEVVEKDDGVFDYIVYGANLTIQGVGDEGAVLVLPWPKDSGTDGNIGRIVVVTLSENRGGEAQA